jgi:hypothetical protein
MAFSIFIIQAVVLLSIVCKDEADEDDDEDDDVDDELT